MVSGTFGALRSLKEKSIEAPAEPPAAPSARYKSLWDAIKGELLGLPAQYKEASEKQGSKEPPQKTN